jgi:hypothetical protein
MNPKIKNRLSQIKNKKIVPTSLEQINNAVEGHLYTSGVNSNFIKNQIKLATKKYLSKIPEENKQRQKAAIKLGFDISKERGGSDISAVTQSTPSFKTLLTEDAFSKVSKNPTSGLYENFSKRTGITSQDVARHFNKQVGYVTGKALHPTAKGLKNVRRHKD